MGETIVILADTNFWLALSLSHHHFHPSALDWFGRQSTPASVLFCRSTQQSMLRLLTTDAVMRAYGIPPMSNAAAWKQYEDLLTDPRIAWAAEPGDPTALQARWKTFAARSTPSAKLWMDAYLAAFAVSGGHKLVTIDKAFRQFKGLQSILLSLTPGTP